MFGKKKDTANVQKAVAAAASFEVTIGDLARKSERRAWMVAFCSLVMSLALAGGYYFMLPLKEKVPYVVMADPFSGTASVAELKDDPFYQSMVANEVLARANVANYVVARESFDAELLKARDWAQVNVMSSAGQRKAYAAMLAIESPSSPARLVRSNQVVRIRVSSVTPVYDAGRLAGATVRIQRNLVNRNSGDAAPIDRRLITLAFSYVPNLELEESLRWLNPLGFVVNEYRSDLDMTALEPGNLDAAFQDAVDSASTLLDQRNADLEALKMQARAVAAAANGEGASATGAPDSGLAPPPDLGVPPSGDTPAPPSPDATVPPASGAQNASGTAPATGEPAPITPNPNGATSS
jgi:type IV secretion system protein VirB8